MTEQAVRDYLLLGLRIGEHVPGFVDSWFGDPALGETAATRPRTPPELVRDATELRERLADSGLSPSRTRYLGAQVVALECTARRLAGEPMPFTTEARAYFDVDVSTGDADEYQSVHDEIRELLPGTGDLRARLAEFTARNTIPEHQLHRAVRAVSEALRERVSELVHLPDGEGVAYELVRDKPWHAFNLYHGGFRSTITLNVDAGKNLAALPLLATHEAYPGHHAEHCVKEAELVTRRGEVEHVISLVNTPQCLVSEGMAEVAHRALLGDGWGRWTSTVLAEHGIHIEGEMIERLHRLWARLLPARQDAALLLHDHGWDTDATAAYLGRWLLLPDDRAHHMVRFLTDPLWRAYTVSYIEGTRLVSRWLEIDTADHATVRDRYRRLLREPFVPSSLREQLAGSAT